MATALTSQPGRGSLLDDGDVDDDPARGVPSVELRRHDLPGPLGEGIQVDRAAEEVRPVEGQLPDPPEPDEDGPPPQRHHEPERARRLVPDLGQQHDIADPSDEQPVAVDQRPPFQARREDLTGGRTAVSRRFRSRDHPPIIGSRAAAHNSHQVPLPRKGVANRLRGSPG